MNAEYDLERALFAVTDVNSTSEILYKACRSLAMAGRHAEAAEALNRLERDFVPPGDLRFLLETAISVRYRGDFEQAIQQLINIQQKFDRNGHAYIIQADMLIERGELKAAQAVLEMAWHKIRERNLRIDVIYRIIKLRSYQSAASISSPFYRPTACSDPLRAALVMMVRDENDIIQANLDHHYALGFRNFVIIDNNSADGTRQSIENFAQLVPEAIVIIISDPVKAYFQGEKTNAATDFAKSYFLGIGREIDWIFILDADEFLSGPSSTSSLADILAVGKLQGLNYLAFALCNAASEDNLFLAENPTAIYEKASIVAAYPRRLTLKNAFHVNFACRITTGNHVLDSDDLDPDKCLVGAEVGWRIIHLPYRSMDQTARKILNGSAAIQARGDAVGIGVHWLALGTEMQADAAATARRKIEQYRAETVAYSEWKADFFRL